MWIPDEECSTDGATSPDIHSERYTISIILTGMYTKKSEN